MDTQDKKYYAYLKNKKGGKGWPTKSDFKRQPNAEEDAAGANKNVILGVDEYGGKVFPGKMLSGSDVGYNKIRNNKDFSPLYRTVMAIRLGKKLNKKNKIRR